MNERMIELMNEANKTVGFTFSMDQAKPVHDLMEKFAKLFVKDFLSVLEYERGYYANPQGYQEEEYYIRCEGKVSVLDDVIDTVKSRYEVER